MGGGLSTERERSGTTGTGLPFPCFLFAIISETAFLFPDADAVPFGELIGGLVYSVAFGLWSLDGAGAAYKQTGDDEIVLVDRNDRPGRPD